MTAVCRRSIRQSLLLLLAAVLCSCGPPPTETLVSAPPTEIVRSELAIESIDWFDGTVEEAFEEAGQTSTPVFLYWGAEWCPPCHAISATVFRSEEFIDRSRLFIPVYLDGDNENAQRAGERFSVLGYPTMIVFSPGGVELTRIPGGMDMNAYANVLDLALGEQGSVDAIVAEVMTIDKALDENECRLLAHYSWNQSPELMEGYVAVELLRAVYDACPENQQPDRSLLYMAYLDERIDSLDTFSGLESLSAAEISEGRRIVGQILSSKDLTRANVLSIIFSSASMTRALTSPGSVERLEMVADFSNALDRLADDESVFKRERVYTSLGKLYLERLHGADAELSVELRAEIETMVAWADESTSDPFERQAVIDAVSNLLRRAEMDDIARAILMAELEVSSHPYYFMPALADIEEAAGNKKKALEWLARGYAEAVGPATRFQWGHYYIVGLLKMDPEDTQRIRQTTVSVIRELEDGVGIYQRPRAQLQRLESSLVRWGEDNYKDDTLKQIRTDVRDLCDRFATQEGSMEPCLSFLDSV